MKKTCKKMRRLFIQTSAIAFTTAVMVGTNLSPANAIPHKYKEFSFQANALDNPVLRVTSSDDKKWDTIETGSGSINVKMRADVKYPSYVGVVGVFLGQCSGMACATGIQIGGAIPVDGNNSLLFKAEGLKTRDYDVPSHTLSFGHRQLGDARMMGGVNKTYKKHILDRCNAELSAKGPAEKVSFLQEIATTFGVGVSGHRGRVIKADKLIIYNIGKTTTSSFWIEVQCEPSKKLIPVETVATIAPMEVKELKHFLSTFSHAFTQPKAGVQCKKGRVLMRVKTNRIGPVKLKLLTKVGNGPGPLKKDYFDVFAKLNEDGVPIAEVKKWFSTTETAVLKAKLVTDEPAGSTTSWKELLLKCSAPGGGGWAQPAPDDGVVDPVVDNTGNESTPSDFPLNVKGELALIDSSKTGHGLARNATAYFKLTSNNGEALSYSLRCNGGRKWFDKIWLQKIGVEKYAYVHTYKFPVTKTEKIKCVLRSTSVNGSPVLDTAERKYFVISQGSKPSSKPTAGNMTQQPGPNVGDNPTKVPLQLKSELTLHDNTVNAPLKKSRYGLVSIKVTSNLMRNLSYQLKCSGDRRWQGKLKLKKKSIGKYTSARSHTFSIKKSELVKCVLQVKANKGLPAGSSAQRHYVVQ